MAPSLSSSLLLVAQVQAQVELADHVLDVVVMATILLGLVLMLALKVGVSRESQPPASSKRGARRSQPPTGALSTYSEAEPVPSSRRRVIRLFDTTPGQSPHEYNIGDPQGSRGSAIVRAA